MKRVAVIGAGPAGLTTLKYLREHPTEVEVVCFERNGQAGGEWLYTDDTRIVDGIRPSALYKSLRANGIRATLDFPDFPFDEDSSLWPTHQEILRHIQAYTKRFQLSQWIKFNTVVEELRVHSGQENNQELWKVTARDLRTEKLEEFTFHSVVVCVGLFQDIVMPEIQGAESFEGELIHSCQYRDAESYRDKTVLVVGRGPSGCDIATELSATAAKVYLSSKPPMKLADNMEVTSSPYIRSCRKDSVTLADNTEMCLDSVIFCTGYAQNYPFLHKSCDLQIKENLLYPLYKLIVHPRHSTLFFNGLTRVDAHFTLVALTAEVVTNIIIGKGRLPPPADMESAIEEEIRTTRQEGKELGFLHKLGLRHEKWARDIAELGKIEKFPGYAIKVYGRIYELMAAGEYHALRTYNIYIDTHGEVQTEKICSQEYLKSSRTKSNETSQ